jgi:hypothetical protein
VRTTCCHSRSGRRPPRPWRREAQSHRPGCEGGRGVLAGSQESLEIGAVTGAAARGGTQGHSPGPLMATTSPSTPRAWGREASTVGGM